MGIFDAFTLASIGAGAIIMFLAVLKTSKLRKLVVGVNVKRWIWLARLMVIFLVGYLVSMTLIIFGYDEPLLLIIGLVFLLGSCFVYLVVFSAKSDMLKINDANALLARKNEELKRINLELDQFAYRTSHDLKAPISSLKGLIDVAAMASSAEEVSGIHELMKERLTSLEFLIRDILDLSKNTKTESQAVPTNVHDVIEQLVRDHGHRDDDKMHVTVAGQRELNVIIDVTRFKIVLGNLISNARQYADWDKQNPFIKINYRKENGSLIVSVKDNGKGIQNDHLTKIFEMFFRIDNDAQGSGLGLYIVKEATEKMGGTIKVTSEKGVGSEFTISIPAAS